MVQILQALAINLMTLKVTLLIWITKLGGEEEGARRMTMKLK